MTISIGYIIPINKKPLGGGTPPRVPSFIELEPNLFLMELEASTDLAMLE